MKKTTTLLSFLIFIFAQSMMAQWTVIPSGTTRNLHDVHFQTEQLGWIAADSGYIMRTTDGGNTWTSTFLSNSPFVSIDFLDADTGYALPAYNVPFITVDGGLTWNPETSLNGACFGKKVGFNGRLAYMIYGGCFGGSWLYTIDPATKDTTELFQFFPFPQDNDYRDLGFPTVGSALVMGSDNVSAFTTDAGDNWTSSGPTDTLLDWRALDFISSTEGYAVTAQDFYPLHKTLDGGQTWVIDSTLAPTFMYPLATDLDYLQPGVGIIIAKVGWADTGLIFELNGPNMQAQSIDQVPRAIYMVNDSVGYIVGDSGMILKRSAGPLTALRAENNTLGFTAYPNPNMGQFNIRWADAELQSIKLFTATGQMIRSYEDPEGQAMEIDLLDQPAGIYFLELRSQLARSTKRIVVQH